MKKIKKEDLNPEIFELYDGYAHNKFNRREFVEKLSFYAVGGLTIPALLEYLMPKYSEKQQVFAEDSRLNTAYIEYDSPKGGGKIKGQLSRLTGHDSKLPGVVVVHENRGLNPHIEDVGRRAGLEGFISLSPDALTPLGGYPGNDDDGRTMQRERDKEEMLQDFIAAFEYLRSHPECDGKVGVVGFCFGGWISNMMAVRVPELKAAVPFYGGQPKSEEVSQIKAPLQLHLAALDERVNAGWQAYEAELMKNNKAFSVHHYPDVQHGFHNDTTPRYEQKSATLAWNRTIEFFRLNLK